MWRRLAIFVLKHRRILLIILFLLTCVMGFYASKVKLSYEFSKAIPTDNPKYLSYQAFRQKFGDDGNLLVLGIQTSSLFAIKTFKRYTSLEEELRQVKGVENVIGIPSAVALIKDSVNEKLRSEKIFSNTSTQPLLDSAVSAFNQLPFYRSVLYSPDDSAYLMAVRINKSVLESPGRSLTIGAITKAAKIFSTLRRFIFQLPGCEQLKFKHTRSSDHKPPRPAKSGWRPPSAPWLPSRVCQAMLARETKRHCNRQQLIKSSSK